MSDKGMTGSVRGGRPPLEIRSSKEPDAEMRVLMVMCSPCHARGSMCMRISSGRRA
jgi:hypothetical protein